MMRYELALGRALAGGRRIARAGVGQRAVGAVRGTCVAGGPAEQNQSVAEIRPLFGRKTGGDFLLDFHGIGVCGPPIRPPTQSSGYAHHMRIDRESGDIERVAEHDVRGFAADPRQAGQFIHRARHHAAESFVQCRGQSDEMLGFRTIEPQRMNDVFDLGRVCGRQVTGGGVGGEQFRGDRVDTLVGGLGAEHGGDQQFERIREMQCASGCRNHLAQNVVFVMHARETRGFGFSHRMDLSGVISMIDSLQRRWSVRRRC